MGYVGEDKVPRLNVLDLQVSLCCDEQALYCEHFSLIELDCKYERLPSFSTLALILKIKLGGTWGIVNMYDRPPSQHLH